jgi:hypothetical protein
MNGFNRSNLGIYYAASEPIGNTSAYIRSAEVPGDSADRLQSPRKVNCIDIDYFENEVEEVRKEISRTGFSKPVMSRSITQSNPPRDPVESLRLRDQQPVFEHTSPINDNDSGKKKKRKFADSANPPTPLKRPHKRRVRRVKFEARWKEHLDSQKDMSLSLFHVCVSNFKSTILERQRMFHKGCENRLRAQIAKDLGRPKEDLFPTCTPADGAFWGVPEPLNCNCKRKQTKIRYVFNYVLSFATAPHTVKKPHEGVDMPNVKNDILRGLDRLLRTDMDDIRYIWVDRRLLEEHCDETMDPPKIHIFTKQNHHQWEKFITTVSTQISDEIFENPEEFQLTRTRCAPPSGRSDFLTGTIFDTSLDGETFYVTHMKIRGQFLPFERGIQIDKRGDYLPVKDFHELVSEQLDSFREETALEFQQRICQSVESD